MAVVAVSKATLAEKKLAHTYLGSVIKSCDSSDHYTIHLTPLAAVQKTNNPPTEAGTNHVRERFFTLDAFELLKTQEGEMLTVTSQGIVPAPMIYVTHFNASLLQEALIQEKSLADPNAKTDEVDLRAWTELPKIIQSQWHRFSSALRMHIMDCMMEFLQNRTQNQSMFFTTTNHHFPHIPVMQPSGKLSDLMQVLVSLDRVDLSKLTPAHEGLKMRFSDAAPRLDRPGR